MNVHAADRGAPAIWSLLEPQFSGSVLSKRSYVRNPFQSNSAVRYKNDQDGPFMKNGTLADGSGLWNSLAVAGTDARKPVVAQYRSLARCPDCRRLPYGLGSHHRDRPRRA